MATDPLDLPEPTGLPHGAVLGIAPHRAGAETAPPLDLPKPGALPPGAVLDIIEQKLEELRALSSQLRSHLDSTGR